MKASGFFRIKLDGKNVTVRLMAPKTQTKLGRVHLEAGKPAQLSGDYTPGPKRQSASARLVWSKVDLKPQPAAD